MAERELKNYGLSGEPEARIEQEFTAVYKALTAGQLEKKFSLPNVKTVAVNKPFLAKVDGNWYIYVRIEEQYARILLTVV